MHVKRYQARNVQDALRAVRQDLGPDALVLATRIVAAPGPRGWFGGRAVELTAAADRTDVPEIRPPAAPAATTRSWPDRAAERFTRRLASAHARAPRRQAASHVERRRRDVRAHFTPFGAGDRDRAPIEVFVGAPGCGKTTAVAGIAARERVRAGAGFGIVAAGDAAVPPGSRAQSYAGVVGAPFVAADSPYQLQTVLETTSVPVLVEIDGVGAPLDDMLRLVAARPDARVHLVIAADVTLEAMRAACDRYAAGRPSRVLVTRTDVAASLEAVTSLLRERRLPVSYVSAGPRVPEDLLPMPGPGSHARWMS